MRNGYIIGILKYVDIQEILKIGGKLVQIYKGLIYRENFKISPFRKFIEKVFAFRQKCKDESNDLMQSFNKLIMKSLCGIQIRKEINESCKCKWENSMKTEYDDNVLDYGKLPNGKYNVKIKKDDELEHNNDKKNALPSQLGAVILSSSKRIMNNFLRKINGFYNNSIYYGDTDSLYNEKKMGMC